MSKFIDYYKVLGVAKDIPQSEIKAAYRKRSKQFHPDLHPDDPKAKAKFQLLNEAYEVLNDPDKRARYDQYGEQWNKVNQGFGGAGNQGGYNGGNPFDGFNPFSRAYGQQGGGNPFDGGFEVNFGQGGFSDFFSELFKGFKGEQKTSSRRHTDNWAQPATDTQATINIDMYTALLGGEAIIQSGSERLKLKIKEGTQPGTKMRLKQKGDPLPNGGRADLILTINVTLPDKLTERQKQLLREMSQQ